MLLEAQQKYQEVFWEYCDSGRYKNQLHELKKHGFCKKTIFDVFLQTIESVYEDTVPIHTNVREWCTGDLVKHRGTQQLHLITKIELQGSEKIYLSEFPPEKAVDPVHLELVSENR